MTFQINVRSLVVVTVLTTLVKAYVLHTSFEDARTKKPSYEQNITEKWTWLYPVNNTEPDNETVLWGKVFPLQARAPPNNALVNWCAHVGECFEKVNFSNFQHTNKCCKEHVLSVLVEVNDNLLYKCVDESEFYDCLKKVDTAMSRSVGHFYFNKEAPTCYEIKEEEYCFRTLCSVLMKITTSALPEF